MKGVSLMTKKRYRKMLRALMTEVWKRNGLAQTQPTGRMLKAVRDAHLIKSDGMSYEQLWSTLVAAFPQEAAILKGGRK